MVRYKVGKETGVSNALRIVVYPDDRSDGNITYEEVQEYERVRVDLMPGKRGPVQEFLTTLFEKLSPDWEQWEFVHIHTKNENVTMQDVLVWAMTATWRVSHLKLSSNFERVRYVSFTEVDAIKVYKSLKTKVPIGKPFNGARLNSRIGVLELVRAKVGSLYRIFRQGNFFDFKVLKLQQCTVTEDFFFEEKVGYRRLPALELVDVSFEDTEKKPNPYVVFTALSMKNMDLTANDTYMRLFDRVKSLTLDNCTVNDDFMDFLRSSHNMTLTITNMDKTVMAEINATQNTRVRKLPWGDPAYQAIQGPDRMANLEWVLNSCAELEAKYFSIDFPILDMEGFARILTEKRTILRHLQRLHIGYTLSLHDAQTLARALRMLPNITTLDLNWVVNTSDKYPREDATVSQVVGALIGRIEGAEPSYLRTIRFYDWAQEKRKIMYGNRADYDELQDVLSDDKTLSDLQIAFIGKGLTEAFQRFMRERRAFVLE